jgi:cytochrome c551/c552
MKKVLKIIAVILIIGLIAIQFINRPDKTTISEVSPDDITKKAAVPADVQVILKRSCYDCHSSQTVWPWYSNIAPVSWLVADDVVKGRQKMNFNMWGRLSASKQEKKFSDIIDVISDASMPLPKYLIIHKDAALSESDKQVLLKWANEQKDKMENGQ